MTDAAYSNSTNGAGSNAAGIVQQITARAKGILFDTDKTWDEIARESKSINEIYKSYLIYIAVIPPIFTWLKFSIIGIHEYGVTVRQGIFSGLFTAILNYCGSLAILYVAAVVLDKLAPKFQAKTNTTNTFKLLAYSSTASAIAGAAVILPWIGMLLGICGGLFSIYLFLKGLPKLVDISAEKKWPYLGASIIVTLLIGVLTFGIINYLTPKGNASGVTIEYGGQKVDLEKLEQNLNELQKSFTTN